METVQDLADDVDEGVARADDSPYDLGGAVGVEEDRAMAVADRLETGTVGINHYGSNPAAPFCGHEDGRVGVEFGPEGIAEYLTFTSLHRPGAPA